MEHSASNHTVHHAANIAKELPALKQYKSPGVAALMGGLFGGFGLGLYLGTWTDFLVPTGIWFALVIMGIPTGGLSMIIGPMFMAAYGYKRAVASNEKLKAASGSVIEVSSP